MLIYLYNSVLFCDIYFLFGPKLHFKDCLKLSKCKFYPKGVGGNDSLRPNTLEMNISLIQHWSGPTPTLHPTDDGSTPVNQPSTLS